MRFVAGQFGSQFPSPGRLASAWGRVRVPPSLRPTPVKELPVAGPAKLFGLTRAAAEDGPVLPVPERPSGDSTLVTPPVPTSRSHNQPTRCSFDLLFRMKANYSHIRGALGSSRGSVSGNADQQTNPIKSGSRSPPPFSDREDPGGFRTSPRACKGEGRSTWGESCAKPHASNPHAQRRPGARGVAVRVHRLRTSGSMSLPAAAHRPCAGSRPRDEPAPGAHLRPPKSEGRAPHRRAPPGLARLAASSLTLRRHSRLNHCSRAQEPTGRAPSRGRETRPHSGSGPGVRGNEDSLRRRLRAAHTPRARARSPEPRR